MATSVNTEALNAHIIKRIRATMDVGSMTAPQLESTIALMTEMYTMGAEQGFAVGSDLKSTEPTEPHLHRSNLGPVTI